MCPSTASTWAEAVHRNEMLRAERVLAEIRVRLKFAGDAELAARCRADTRLLVGALDGVLALHRPGSRGRCRICARRPPYRAGPCVTVRTISRCIDAPPAGCTTHRAGQPGEGDRGDA